MNGLDLVGMLIYPLLVNPVERMSATARTRARAGLAVFATKRYTKHHIFQELDKISSAAFDDASCLLLLLR